MILHEKEKIVIVTGPTASGKTSLSIDLALKFNGEIISADSLQIYKELNIGTAKPTEVELKQVRHHLIDKLNVREDYSAALFRSNAMEAIKDIRSRGKNVFISGGTGLYIRALLRGLVELPSADKHLREEYEDIIKDKGLGELYARLNKVDPESCKTIHANNKQRIIRALEIYDLTGRPISEFKKEHAFKESFFQDLIICLAPKRDILYSNIELRVDNMIKEGLVEEVEYLLQKGFQKDLKPMASIGYKEIIGYLDGLYSLEDAVYLIKKNTWQYAKRQITWFKKEKDVMWFDGTEAEEKEKIYHLIEGFFNEA